MKTLYSQVFAILFPLLLSAQVPQNVIIEHFTNSRCGICASKNPSFYNTLSDYPQVLHIAFHPSSPYSSCIFSAHNPSENDERTNYYGIYGGTPRVVIQGEVVSPGGSLISPSAIESKLGMNSAYKIEIEHFIQNGGNYLVKAKINKVANDGQSLVFRGFLAEGTINYNAPNGEDVHYDVFRKNIFNEAVTLSQVGDSVVLTTTYQTNFEWVQNEIYVVGVLQNQTDKSIAQSAKSGSAEVLSVNTASISSHDLFYPNPASRQIQFTAFTKENFKDVRLFTLLGKEVLHNGVDQAVDVNDLQEGYYLLVFEDESGITYTSKLLVR